jgi:hypothetical protein
MAYIRSLIVNLGYPDTVVLVGWIFLLQWHLFPGLPYMNNI